MANVKPIPDGYHAVTPYLAIAGAAKAIEFYKQAFGAKERFRMPSPDGAGVGHAELQIGDSVLMLADEFPAMDFHGPRKGEGTSVMLHLYVSDVDATQARAIRAGARELRPVKDQFYGDRSGTIEDPFGHLWSIATHKEDLTPDQIARRAAEEFGKPPPGDASKRK